MKKQMTEQLGHFTTDYFLNNRFLEQLAELEPMDVPMYKQTLIASFYKLIYEKEC